jgi:hypothetical protein
MDPNKPGCLPGYSSKGVWNLLDKLDHRVNNPPPKNEDEEQPQVSLPGGCAATNTPPPDEVK